MIEVEQLSKRYGSLPVLREVTLTVASGQLTTLIGTNGAGKTTLLRVLAGLTAPDGGSARLNGVDVVRRRTEAQAQLAFLPQAVRFHPALSARQLLRFYADLRATERRRIEPLLAEVGLEDAADRPSGQLSGGMAQRLGLALMLLPDAPILLLDEPGVSLDPTWRAQMVALLRAEADRGKTVFVTTHLLAEWQPVSDRMLRCEDGCILDTAPAPVPAILPTPAPTRTSATPPPSRAKPSAIPALVLCRQWLTTRCRCARSPEAG